MLFLLCLFYVGYDGRCLGEWLDVPQSQHATATHSRPEAWQRQRYFEASDPTNPQLIQNLTGTCCFESLHHCFPCVSSILDHFLVLFLGSFWIHFGGSARSPRRRSRSRHRRSRSRSPVAKLKSREVRAPSKTFLGNSLGVFSYPILTHDAQNGMHDLRM